MTGFDQRFVLGLSLSLLNCFLSSAGFTLQRKSQLLLEEEQLQGGKRSFQLLWCIGVALYILAAVPDVLAYTLVPQVVCTTVACFRLVVVSILAHTFLGERLQGREVLGMLACSVGTFLCLFFGPRPGHDAAEQASAEEFYHPQVWTYLGIGLSLLCCLLVTEHADEISWFKAPEHLHYVILPLATGLAFALEKVFNTEIGFVQTPSSVEGLLHAPLWLGMVLSIGLLGCADFYLNLRGAARMPVQVFVPISFALATSLQFFQSVALFGEFSAMSPLHAWLSASGALVSLTGAMFIQPPRWSLLQDHEEFKDQLDEEEVGDLE